MVLRLNAIVVIEWAIRAIRSRHAIDGLTG